MSPKPTQPRLVPTQWTRSILSSVPVRGSTRPSIPPSLPRLEEVYPKTESQRPWIFFSFQSVWDLWSKENFTNTWHVTLKDKSHNLESCECVVVNNESGTTYMTNQLQTSHTKPTRMSRNGHHKTTGEMCPKNRHLREQISYNSYGSNTDVLKNNQQRTLGEFVFSGITYLIPEN
jgi:hypothetical protein